MTNRTINNVYPWGRGFEEYVRMFALSESDLAKRIVGVGDGPASFNAVMRQRGYRVVSCDPLYGFSVEQVRARIDATLPVMIDKVRTSSERLVWNDIRTVDELITLRMAAMRTTRRVGARDGIASRRCRSSHWPMTASIWPCARTCCSFTVMRCRWAFTCDRSWRCAAWHGRCGSFRWSICKGTHRGIANLSRRRCAIWA